MTNKTATTATTAEQLITEHINIWSSAILAKSSSGRGSSKKYELYGIRKLRGLILELAIRGKLVPQDANDEPTSKLLEKIAEERAKLIEKLSIRKRKPLSDISSKEHPYKIPQGWEWMRLGNTGISATGKTPKTSEKRFFNGSIPFIGPGQITTANSILIPEKTLTEEGLKQSTEANENDILMVCIGGSIGKAAIADKTIGFNQQINSIKPITIVPKYLFFSIQSGSFYSKLIEASTGSATPIINRGKWDYLLVPIPPLAEQHRIVAKVDELMQLCDQLEQQTEDSIEAHATLVEVLLNTLTESSDADELAQNWTRLAEHFDTLFITEQSIDALNQTILQLAVMGKLVPQNPDDEPASVLLDKLRVERNSILVETKQDNPESKTMLTKLKKLIESKAPYKLPSSWSSAHLIDLSMYLVDCHNKTAPYVDEGIPIIRTSNIRNRHFTMIDIKYISEETYEYWSRRCPPQPNDIIFTREAPMGEAGIIPEGAKWCLGQRTMLIRPMRKYISNEYLLITLTEPHLLERASERAIGSTVKHLRVGDVERLNIPLPPLAEQHRIVDKVDELMAICDQLKANLQQAQVTQVRLTDALVDSALA